MPCPSPNYTGGQKKDLRWRNYIRSVDITVRDYWTPNTLQELVRIVQHAESEGRSVHAVGAGYSFEDLAATPDCMVDLSNLSKPISRLVDESAGSRALTEEWRTRQLGDGTQKLAHVEAGARLFDLVQHLKGKNQALPTMGGALGQTVAGAISTSTHGSDVNLPPLCDLVHAVHLVTTGGREMWIEGVSRPVTGDDAALRAALRACPDLEIVRDDDMLDSVVVGMGRFGIIYSVVLEVTSTLRLAEFSQSLRWPDVAAALARGVGPAPRGGAFGALHDLLRAPPSALQIAGTARNYRYLDLVFSTRNRDVCWVRRRWPTRNTTDLNVGSSSDILCHKGVANGLLAAAGAGLGKLSVIAQGIPGYGLIKGPQIAIKAAELTATAANPHLTGGAALAAVLNALWALQDEAIGGAVVTLVNEIAHKAVADALTKSETEGRRGLNWVIAAGSDDPRSIGDCFRGNSIEIIFGLDSRTYLDFLQAVLNEAGKYNQAGYVSVRFSRRSRALLSMHNIDHELACSIEITSLQGLADNDRWMGWVERKAVEMGGRPHWGQQHRLDRAQVERLYPADRLRRWRTQLRRVAGTGLTFSNAFTKRRGLEPVYAGPAGTVPLDLYWGAGRGDNFTTATDIGRRDAEAAGYRYVRTEGFVFPRRGSGMVPLDLYWSAARGDNFITATDAGRRDATAAGYRMVRTEGFVFPTQRPGTVPLRLYWGEARGDNFATASDRGRRDAEAAGYRSVRVEGYVFPQAIALRTILGTYVGADGGGGSRVDARRPALGEHETFEVVYLDGGRIALRTYGGYFVCAEGGGGREVVANRTWIGDWERFELVAVSGSKIALRAPNRQFVVAEGGGGGAVAANRPRVESWEIFELIGV